jgi:hypothetical protein
MMEVYYYVQIYPTGEIAKAGKLIGALEAVPGRKYVTPETFAALERDGIYSMRWNTGADVIEPNPGWQDIRLSGAREKRKFCIRVEMIHEREEAGQVVFAGRVIAATERALTDTTALIDIMTRQQLQTVQYRAKDNTFFPVTLAELKSMKDAITDFGLSLYQRKWQREAEIDAATTEAAIDAIIW